MKPRREPEPSRKQIETEHYDRQARQWRSDVGWQQSGPAETGEPPDPGKSSDRFVLSVLRRVVPGARVLDWGCGRGDDAVRLAEMGAQRVVGIDLSAASLAVAEERLNAHANLRQRVRLHRMDAEALAFSSESFDVVLDRGTFSSVDFAIGLSEVARVLRPGGHLVGLETLGRHPVANLKRRVNRWRGARTAWASSHVLRLEQLEAACGYFSQCDIRCFHLIFWPAGPLAAQRGARPIRQWLERLDAGLLARWSGLRPYAFKAGFVLTKGS